MILIVMTPLWFWEEPTYYADTLSPNPVHWNCGVAYSPLGVFFEWSNEAVAKVRT